LRLEQERRRQRAGGGPGSSNSSSSHGTGAGGHHSFDTAEAIDVNGPSKKGLIDNPTKSEDF
jgi:hypothetical protein